MKKLLLVFAHPDDESFLTGGTVAKYAQADWDVHLVCITRGEAGNTGAYGAISQDSLGNIRQKELEEAGTTLGISSITFLGYTDGVLSDVQPGELEDKIFKEMSSFSPDVVITFESGGVSNHPDHIKTSLSTTFAFQKYALEKEQLLAPQRPGQRGKRWMLSELERQELSGHEPRLYYGCIPESVITYLIKQKVIPAESFSKRSVGVPDKSITTVIDISKFTQRKIKAIRSHKTQQNNAERFLSSPTNPLFSQEYFVLRMQGTSEVFMGKNDRVANRL